MVDIINQGHTGLHAHRQQIRWRIHPVIVFQGEPAFNILGEMVDNRDQAFQCRCLVPVCPTAVDVDHVGGHPFGHLGMVFQVRHRAVDHAGIR